MLCGFFFYIIEANYRGGKTTPIDYYTLTQSSLFLTFPTKEGQYRISVLVTLVMFICLRSVAWLHRVNYLVLDTILHSP